MRRKSRKVRRKSKSEIKIRKKARKCLDKLSLLRYNNDNVIIGGNIVPKEEKKPKKVIKKKTRVTVSNTMNQMIFEQRNMTLQAFRMLMFYLAKINPKRPEFTMVKVPLETYADMLGVELNEKAIDESTTLLMGYVLKTGEIDKGSYIIKNSKYNIFSVCHLTERKSDGKLMLELKCSEDVKPLIFEMKGKFTGFSVWNVLNLSNFQDIRMYMLLSQYKVAGRQTFTIEELKDKLGISKDAYPEYKIFSRDVLKKCQKALEERTDIRFEFRSVGRPAHSVKFDIYPNENYRLLKYLEESENPEQPQLPEAAEFPEQITIDNQEIPAELPQNAERKLSFAEIERIDVAEAARHGMGSDHEFTVDDMLEIATGIIHSDWWRDSKTELIGTDDETRIRKHNEVARYTEAQYVYTKSRSRSRTKEGFKKYLVGAVRGNYAEVEAVADPKSEAKKPQGSFDTQAFFAAALVKSGFDPENLEN